MIGNWSGRRAAAIAVLSVAASACGYESTATDPVYVDTTVSADRIEGRRPRVIAASGNLTSALAEFRDLVGSPQNVTAGEKENGRREIRWDGVTGALLNVNTFPADFFKTQGEIYSTEGSGFRVSDNDLADLNPTYANEFSAFSPTKIFISVGSPVMSVRFVVAGSTTPARVNGFGVVFSDVDTEGSTSLAFFDAAGRLLRQVRAPVRSDAAGFSFVGVVFPNAIVARVRIVSGQAAITGRNADISAGGDADLVVMDDFISGEPHAIR